MSSVLAEATATTATAADGPSATRVRIGVGFRIVRDLVTVAVWAVLAVAGGIALAAGLSLVGWAISGFGSANAGGVLRVGIDVYAVGQGLPLQLGAGLLTVTPLAVTAVSLVMLGTMVGRGRLQSDWATAELANLIVAATVGTRLLATPGAVQSADWWRPTLLAALVLALMLVRGSTVSFLIQARLPDWGLAGLKGAAVAVMTLLGGAALVFILGVLTATSRAGHVLTLAATGFGPGIGQTLTSAAFLPNAVVAAAGYVSSAGFGVGAATYSPLGSHLTTLPALPLLTAAPDDPGSTYVDLLVLVVPLAAGAVAGWVLLRGIAARVDRLFGAAVVGVAGGLLLAVAASVASGGVRGGSWATSGADPWRLALVAGVEFALVAGLVAVIGPDRSGPKPSLREILRGLRRDREAFAMDGPEVDEDGDDDRGAGRPGRPGRTAAGRKRTAAREAIDDRGASDPDRPAAVDTDADEVGQDVSAAPDETAGETDAAESAGPEAALPGPLAGSGPDLAEPQSALPEPAVAEPAEPQPASSEPAVDAVPEPSGEPALTEPPLREPATAEPEGTAPAPAVVFSATADADVDRAVDAAPEAGGPVDPPDDHRD